MLEFGGPMAPVAVASLLLFVGTSALFALWVARMLGLAAGRREGAGAVGAPTPRGRSLGLMRGGAWGASYARQDAKGEGR